MDSGNWIGIAALGVSIGVLILGYLNRNPLVSASRVKELRDANYDLQKELDEARREIGRLRQRVHDLLLDADVLREERRGKSDD